MLSRGGRRQREASDHEIGQRRCGYGARDPGRDGERGDQKHGSPTQAAVTGGEDPSAAG
jgi:hypothetical protein